MIAPMIETTNDAVSSLADLRRRLLDHDDQLCALEPRCDDVLWPLRHFNVVGAAKFESTNTCLVSQPVRSTLWLGDPILDDIAAMMPEDLRQAGIKWFFTHQLCHVSQGLAYVDFRTLNNTGNRHETMRPDCDADFSSLKTMALLNELEHAERSHTGEGPSWLEHMHFLTVSVVPRMIAMEPNIFIPYKRDVEIKRLIALQLFRYYFEQRRESGSPVPNASVFPWWADDYSAFYVFVGQVSTLGRGAIPVEPDVLRRIVESFRDGASEEGYELMLTIDWPELNDDTLPTRLLAS
jgi:hypothetical protein